ncbi:MAG: lysine biosynthesis protein LysX [Nitrososphaerota archaeon]|nr:lysine biosynthesis protein LysX [Candidatus Bathyarchaeota archaeon]MDW8048434.1 lysine biosynthesis protein LysX [Nitrososphaerota archaeon]
MKNLGLVYDRIRWDEKALVKAAESASVNIKLIDSKTAYVDLSIEDSKLKDDYGDVVLQRCVSYFRGLHITAILEKAGISVINPLNVSLICGNKLFTTLALIKADVPVPKTYIAFAEDGVSKAFDELGYPVVMKPVVGSWGRLVALIRDRDSAKAVVESREQMQNALLQIYYLQEYVKRPPRDIRALVIGDKVVAASYRYSPEGEWRTNVARGGVSKPCPVTSDLEEIVLRAAESVGGGVLAVDCMESPDGILVHEVNNTVEFRGLYSATRVDIPGEIIRYAVKVMKK